MYLRQTTLFSLTPLGEQKTPPAAQGRRFPLAGATTATFGGWCSCAYKFSLDAVTLCVGAAGRQIDFQSDFHSHVEVHSIFIENSKRHTHTPAQFPAISSMRHRYSQPHADSPLARQRCSVFTTLA